MKFIPCLALTLTLTAHLLLAEHAYSQTNIWSFPTGSDITSSPAIGDDGTVYFGSYDQNFYAVNPDSSLRWSLSVTAEGKNDTVNLYSSPAIGPDGTVYFGTEHLVNNGVKAQGELHAVDPLNGTNKWIRIFTNDIWAALYSPPAIAPDGTIYVGCYNTNLYAINPADGTDNWVYTADEQIFAGIAIGAKGTIYFGADDGKLYALHPSGTNLWTFPGGQGFTGSPAVGSDGTIYFGATWGTSGRRLYAVNPDGTEKWNYPVGGFVESSPAIGKDGAIYFGSNDNKLHAVNPDGTAKWSVTTGDDVKSSPAIAEDGTIYVGSSDGKLYAFDTEGTNLWCKATGAAIVGSPSIGIDGTIYVGSTDSSLHAVYGTSPLARSPWAMFHRNPWHTAKQFTPASIHLQPQPIGEMQLTLTGEPGQNYEVLAANDLQNWQNLTNLVSPSPTATLIDSSATNHNVRFYRSWSK